MPYRPTGRPTGRPRAPVTPDGKLQKARRDLPHVRAFPDMRRAVDRALYTPHKAFRRAPTKNAKDVEVEYRYTPAERGQILAYTWWVYTNRKQWPRRRLTSAVTALSPLMLFPSTFLGEMTGLSRHTVRDHMIRAASADISRITGTCDPWAVHQLLELATHDMDEYRHGVRELSLTKGIPDAMLSRLSGIPRHILLRPDRGVQFFAEDPDDTAGVVQHWKHLHEQRQGQRGSTHAPRPGEQRAVRDALAGRPLYSLNATSAPVPDDGQPPYHRVIPGLPSPGRARELGSDAFHLIREWELAYHLPAPPGLGVDEEPEPP